jgi:hypothetical protein
MLLKQAAILTFLTWGRSIALMLWMLFLTWGRMQITDLSCEMRYPTNFFDYCAKYTAVLYVFQLKWFCDKWTSLSFWFLGQCGEWPCACPRHLRIACWGTETRSSHDSEDSPIISVGKYRYVGAGCRSWKFITFKLSGSSPSLISLATLNRTQTWLSSNMLQSFWKWGRNYP